MTSAKERGIFDMLALSTVKRWAIVDMSRPQSVAEHSYRVWVLVQDLYDQLFPTDHNTFEHRAASDWSLIHDAEEVYTGDIPSTVKAVLEELSSGITDRLKEHVLRDKLPAVMNRYRGLKGTLPAYLVKIADTVEAILYVREYGVNPYKKLDIEYALKKTLQEVLNNVSNRYTSIAWANVHGWCKEVLDPASSA